MRILLVEDKPDFADRIEKAIRAIDGCDCIWKRSKASALAALSDEPFDVVLLDRRIPSSDEVLDDDVYHGWDVFQRIREEFPGTSVWFLSGTEDIDFTNTVLNDYPRTGDIHACGKTDAVYRVFWKRRINDCIAAVRDFRAEIKRTDAVSLEQADEPANFRREEERLLRLFGRSHDGTSVLVKPLSGGLSGVRVLSVIVRNAAGQPILTSIAKIGGLAEIEAELTRYRNEIARLAPGYTPQKTGEITLGASGYAGVFYAVVGSEVTDLFLRLVEYPDQAAIVPRHLLDAQAPWFGARELRRVRVSVVRRRLLGEVEFEGLQGELQGIDVQAAEQLEIDAAYCVQHGDLHCANVLFDDRDNPMLIDYAETGFGPACLDPITLELSTIFHSHSPNRHGWPSEEQAETWPDMGAFVAGSPFEGFLRACREWAVAAASSEREVWAVGYAYALRQLKYEDTDKSLARSIVNACVTALLRNA